MAKHHLTKIGYDKLVLELKQLENKELPYILEKLKIAIEQGDLSENAEYEQAMEDKGMTEKRIAELKEFLDNVEIIEGVSSDVVGYGNTVKIERDGNEETFEIVGSGEVDIFKNRISLHSPLGESIRDKKAGDKIIVKSPRGNYEIKLLSIS